MFPTQPDKIVFSPLFCTPLLLCALFLAGGCGDDDDGGQNNTNDNSNTNSNTNTNTNTNTNSNTNTNDNANGNNDCSGSCTVGDLQCVGFGLETCVESTPCPLWELEELCSDAQLFCDDQGTTPLCTTCDPRGTDCATGDQCTLVPEPAPGTGMLLGCTPLGAQGEGDSCSTDACDAGLTCVGANPSIASCWRLCQGSADCPGTDTHCIWPYGTQPGATSAWGICDDGCDPVSQTDCDPGEGCVYSDPADGSTLCWTAGSLPEGSDCSFDLCEPGTDCFADPGSSPVEYYCRRYCDADTPCPGTFTCTTIPGISILQVCLP